MTTWKFKELEKLSREKGLRNTKIYQEALFWKEARAEYHAKRAQEVWRELCKSHQVVQFGSTEWNKTQLASEAETEACVQALHSMADILAQIINLAILPSPLPEKKVYLKEVHKKLQDSPALGVADAINELFNSQEFKYITGFCNTIKHRRLLDTQYREEVGVGRRNKQGVRFLEFSYGNDHFLITWACDIYGPYRKTIMDLFCKVGNEVDNYLRTLP